MQKKKEKAKTAIRICPLALWRIPARGTFYHIHFGFLISTSAPPDLCHQGSLISALFLDDFPDGRCSQWVTYGLMGPKGRDTGAKEENQYSEGGNDSLEGWPRVQEAEIKDFFRWKKKHLPH